MYYDGSARAHTTAALRKQIQEAEGRVSELAERFGVSPQTIRKWRRRDSVHDRSHRPKRLQTNLNGSQENLVVFIRLALRLPLDDLLALTRQFILPSMSRSALDRTLRRRGVSRLATLRPLRSTSAGSEDYMAISALAATAVGHSRSAPMLLVASHGSSRWTFARSFEALGIDGLEGFLDDLSAAAPVPPKAFMSPLGERMERDPGAPPSDRFGWRAAARLAITAMPTWEHWLPSGGSGSGRAPVAGEPISAIVKNPQICPAEGWSAPVRQLFEQINREAQLPCLDMIPPLRWRHDGLPNETMEI